MNFMRHRIFIAINLPNEIKRDLAGYEGKWPDLPARWIRPENLHITLAFIGYVSDEEVVNICEVAKKAVAEIEPFSIGLNRIIYGPPKKNPPRMVWLEGEKSEELKNLQERLENDLSEIINYSPENRSFKSHITLARIKEWEFRRIEPEERPIIEEDVSFNFDVGSIEIMESDLKRGGSEYTILESIPFKTD